ncbi:NADP-dependent oxidoreductase domain-containing protein 1 isoform X2 [Melanotaenia boesemani]|uniref:NADP-dependent oxidoreductase domain-containing protein 1 isoform X2 n=1 Tax=Melanotaenia boesemani TaxID=1250792 RepID=UPI001C03C4F3|nr:NADP-dependent oxidoreductase domain-containing protein 1 isoform X2 [Melanotaenia boesemani]
MDVVAGLSSLSFESELTEDEKKLLYLRARSAGLTFCGCAHAAFVCQLLHSLRCSIKSYTGVTQSVASAGNGDLGVGILGMGRLGKQLLLGLLEKTSIKPSYIKISTRNPEKSLPAEVECFFNNRRLAAWADVMFLCCLPSHLPKICRDLRSHLSKRCLVYSFTSAVPVTRLAHLLGHDFIIKPQYEFVPCDTEDLWLSCCHLTKALTDPFLIEASCPLTIKGGITLSLNWVCAVLYSLMNVCTSASLGSTETISLINNIFKEKGVNNVQLHAHSFISSSVPLSDEFFPWISLIDAQTKDTPLLHFLSSSKSMQQCISALYKSHLERPLK